MIDPGQLLIDSIARLDFWPLSRLDSTLVNGDRLDRLLVDSLALLPVAWMGELAEYHLNYPFPRWRYIFEAEMNWYVTFMIRMYGYWLQNVKFLMQALSNFYKMRYCCVLGWLVLLLDAS